MLSLERRPSTTVTDARQRPSRLAAAYRLGAWAFTMAGVVLAAYVLAGLGLSHDAPVRLTVENPRVALGVVQPLETFELEFVLHNEGSAAVEIIGADDRCDAQGCSQTFGLPLTLPPSESAVVRIKFQARVPGELRREISLYVRAARVETVILTIEGQVVELPAGSSGTAAAF